MNSKCIELRGVEVHNLKKIDLDIPHRALVVCCGVSGSGKTSLALDTLYAEGQRRYIESFSAYTRQFLERMDKPAAERIEGIPPSVAVTVKSPSKSTRATVSTGTEIDAYLRLLYAKIGQIVCHGCGKSVNRDTPDSAAKKVTQLPDDMRLMIGFLPATIENDTYGSLRKSLLEDGFVRAIIHGKTCSLDQPCENEDDPVNENRSVMVIVDRLTGNTSPERVRESFETAFRHGTGKSYVVVMTNPDAADSPNSELGLGTSVAFEVDGRPALRFGMGTRLVCEECDLEFSTPDPRLFNFNSPLGACPRCEGFGNCVEVDLDLAVPDKIKTLEGGAIAPWNTPAYKHELEELLALAKDYDLPVNIPYCELEPRHLELIQHGVPEREFGGLDGFFAWLEKQKYKTHSRVFLNRWRSTSQCPECMGTKLRKESLAVCVDGNSIANVNRMKVADAFESFRNLNLSEHHRSIGRMMLEQVQTRLRYLVSVGLGYLTLDRQLKTLSGGEAQRVALTSALGSSLVNMLYVLDEPSVGLHPKDTDQLLQVVKSLRDRGNTVVVVEHEETFLRTADHLIEIGPAAGENGGQVIYEGTADGMLEEDVSLTGEYLAGRRGIFAPDKRRQPKYGRISLRGARGNNLQNVTVDIPLGLLCLVTGVSGAGKSTLVQETLYPALCRRKRKESETALPYDDVIGDGQIDDVILVDQSPIGKSPRSNPVTYIKAFDAIRNVFAETIEARTHNYSASHFSFNVDGGRCTACQGDGHVQIDMQFLADVYMKCSQCQGQRYRREILNITYRGKTIADVLQMSVRQAFSFFRGQAKVQKKLKQLMDVGLDYLRLGQPANTLSAGEAQRLKLAGYLSSAKRHRTLFLLDEPTTGLHFSDIVKLLDCFESLIAVGHSLVIVEHNLQLMKAADYIIDMGPGAADEGGSIVCTGSPEEVSQNPDSHTGRYLAAALAEEDM